MQKFDKCDNYLPQDYESDGIDYTCPWCNDGYFWHKFDRKCSLCTIKDCKDCLSTDLCGVCNTGFIQSPTRDSCVKPLANCDSLPSEYEI